MKLLHTADWHLGKLLEGCSRLEEQRIVLAQFCEMACTHDVDAICIAGDVFDNSHPSAAAEELFYSTIKVLSDEGRRLVIVIAGNHDQALRLEAIAPLAREHGIVIFGTPKSEILSGKYGSFDVEALDAGVFSVNFKRSGETGVFACVPYPGEKSLNEVLYNEADDEEKKAEDYTKRVARLLESRASYFRSDTVNVMISHVYTMNSTQDGSERGIMLGSSYMLPTDIFPESAQYVALGHVHRPQRVPGSHGRIRYSGSILPYRLTETVIAKQCCLVTLFPGKACEVEDLYFNNPKPIEKWVCKSYEETLERCRQEGHRSCYVYLRIYTDSFIREEQIRELKKYKSDILEIVPVFPDESQELTMESVAEKDFMELFEDYYKFRKGVAASQDLLELLAQVVEGGEDSEADFTDS